MAQHLRNGAAAPLPPRDANRNPQPLTPNQRSPITNRPCLLVLPSGMADSLLDTRDRPLSDLRISVTDRCNFRCVYCMPREVFGRDFQFLPRADLLTFEEITRLAAIFVGVGVEKIRVTGGEPLVRKDIEKLIQSLAGLPGLRDLTLTTNGSLLTAKAQALKEAGLKRVTVSFDALDDEKFRLMNDAGFPVARVLAGIEAAQAAGLAPIKVNMVVKRGVNDDQILPMAGHFRGSGHVAAVHRIYGRGYHQRLAHERRGGRRRDHRSDRCAVAHRGSRSNRPRRGCQPLPISRRRGRDRHSLLRHPAFLLHLCSRPPLGPGRALHLPVRRQGSRPASFPADRRRRRPNSGRRSRDLDPSPRSLFGDSHLQHPSREEGRDVVHRRLNRTMVRCGKVKARRGSSPGSDDSLGQSEDGLRPTLNTRT